MTPTAIATVAVDTLLVTRADIPRVVVFDLVQSLQMMGPLLVALRPDIAVDELETFQISHLTFPVHGGALAFRSRNDPGFAERAGTIFEVVVTIAAGIFTGLFALARFWRGRRKGRIDEFYTEALAIRAKLTQESSAQQRAESMTEARALRDRALALLIDEKLAADESFRILQALIHDVIRECETPPAPPEMPALGDPMR
jgi:signal transduction histidine kinase